MSFLKSLMDLFSSEPADSMVNPAEPRKFSKPPKRNQINVIKPYVWNGLWVFDDESVGLDKEALVAGMPEMILHACAAKGIKDPENGFLALFSKDPFPGATIRLKWVREEYNGNVYLFPEANIEGWLCPALFQYFEEAPKEMYVDLRPIQKG